MEHYAPIEIDIADTRVIVGVCEYMVDVAGLCRYPGFESLSLRHMYLTTQFLSIVYPVT
jgi:hypothetical protein